MGEQGEAGFRVEPAALHELAALLDRARQHVDGARKHLAKMEEFEGGEGLLGGCLDGHRAAYAAVGGWLDRVADPILAETSGAITSTARQYEITDRATAANLDAAHPATDVDRARKQAGTIPIESEGTPWFGDAADPRRYLDEEPGDYHEQLATKMSWWDATSAMSWAGEAIETVSHVAVWLGWLDRPFHPQERLVEPYAKTRTSSRHFCSKRCRRAPILSPGRSATGLPVAA